VLDLDGDTEEENFIALKELVKRFVLLKIKYTAWHTGGKGYHIHTFWNRLDTVSEPKLMKDTIIKHLVGTVKAKVDFQLSGRHLVRMEGGLYEKKFQDRLYKNLSIKQGEHFEENTIPSTIWAEYAKEVLKWALRRLNPTKDKRPFKGMPNCMKHILSSDFRKYDDGGKRSLFIIASYYRKMEDEKLFQLLDGFNQYRLKIPLSRYQIKSTISSVREHKGRPVGCAYRHALLREIGAGKEAEKCELARGAKHIGVTCQNDSKTISK